MGADSAGGLLAFMVFSVLNSGESELVEKCATPMLLWEVKVLNARWSGELAFVSAFVFPMAFSNYEARNSRFFTAVNISSE